MTRRPADPEEELRWMAQEVRGYVEAVLNSLAANVPKVSFYFTMPLLYYAHVLFLIELVKPFSAVFVCPGCCTLPSRESKRRHAYKIVQFYQVCPVFQFLVFHI